MPSQCNHFTLKVQLPVAHIVHWQPLDLTFNSQADDMQYHSVVQYMCKGAFPAFPRCNVQASAIVFNPAVQPQIRESGEVSEISFAAGAEGVVCGCTGSEMAFVAAGLLHMCSLHAAN